MDRDAITFEDDVRAALHAIPMRKDATQPHGLGSPCAATKVTRCLYGEPGTTYKYLGLRMFATPWSNTPIDRLRAAVEKRTCEHTDETDGSSNPSSYTVCLINCMDPPSTETSWKQDSLDSNYSTAVSWHADSSLEHFSTIAVYQTFDASTSADPDGSTTNKSTNDLSWYVGLRVSPHAEGPTSGKPGVRTEQASLSNAPPVAVSLPSNACYYMLREFNHHHQHTVLLRRESEAVRRYSCTFRLLRPQHTIQELLERCRRACQLLHKRGTRIFRSEQVLLTELESDWLRQYYIQGLPRTDDWYRWMQELWTYWSRLEHRTSQNVTLLQRAARYEATQNHEGLPAEITRKERDKQRKAYQAVQAILDRESQQGSGNSLKEVLTTALEERARMREQWAEREKDRVFAYVGYQPLPFRAAFSVPDAACPRSSPLPADARSVLKALQLTAEPLQTDFFSPISRSNGSGAWALEVQQPWSRAILEGEKSIETRTYNLPGELRGQKLYILETRPGETGVSGLGDYITFEGNDIARLVGWIEISNVFKYTSADQFRNDESRHMVDVESGYGWKAGETSCIYGWEVNKYQQCNDTGSFYSASRRKRSLFELHPSAYDE